MSSLSVQEFSPSPARNNPQADSFESFMKFLGKYNRGRLIEVQQSNKKQIDRVIAGITPEQRVFLKENARRYRMPPDAFPHDLIAVFNTMAQDAGILRHGEWVEAPVYLNFVPPNATEILYDESGCITGWTAEHKNSSGFGRFAVDGDDVICWLNDYVAKATLRYTERRNAEMLTEDDRRIMQSTPFAESLLELFT